MKSHDNTLTPTGDDMCFTTLSSASFSLGHQPSELGLHVGVGDVGTLESIPLSFPVLPEKMKEQGVYTSRLFKWYYAGLVSRYMAKQRLNYI